MVLTFQRPKTLPFLRTVLPAPVKKVWLTYSYSIQIHSWEPLRTYGAKFLHPLNKVQYIGDSILRWCWPWRLTNLQHPTGMCQKSRTHQSTKVASILIVCDSYVLELENLYTPFRMRNNWPWLLSLITCAGLHQDLEEGSLPELQGVSQSSPGS